MDPDSVLLSEAGHAVFELFVKEILARLGSTLRYSADDEHDVGFACYLTEMADGDTKLVAKALVHTLDHVKAIERERGR